VHIDADNLTVAQRQGQLARALREGGQGRRGKDEPITHVIPRRNIETWLTFLAGGKVDEETDYKRQGAMRDCRSEARRLASLLSGQETCPDDTPPSLRTAQDELARLPSGR
jgi:hypothetical protein